MESVRPVSAGRRPRRARGAPSRLGGQDHAPCRQDDSGQRPLCSVHLGKHQHSQGVHYHSSSTCTAAQASRILQHAQFPCDVVILEILTTLRAGACVCMPNEEGLRQRLAFGETLAYLTPSLVLLLSPEDLPSLRTLVMGAKPLTPQTIQTIAGRPNLHHQRLRAD